MVNTWTIIDDRVSGWVGDGHMCVLLKRVEGVETRLAVN